MITIYKEVKNKRNWNRKVVAQVEFAEADRTIQQHANENNIVTHYNNQSTAIYILDRRRPIGG